MTRGCCRSAIGPLLTHINLLLMLYSGAGLAAAARLKWDPTIYVVFRELAPQEYAGVTVFVFVSAVLTLLLSHLVVCVLAMRRRRLLRKAGLILYAFLTVVLIVGEVVVAVYAYVRVKELLTEQRIEHLNAIMAAHSHILSALEELAPWFPLPGKVHDVVKEAEKDFPINGYVSGGLAVILLLLQLTAVALSSVEAALRPEAKSREVPVSSNSSLHSENTVYMPNSRMRLTFHSDEDNKESSPLRTTYKDGRLVMI